VLIAAALASVAVIAVLVARCSYDERAAVIGKGQRGPIRGGTLPRGLDRSRAHDFRLVDARGGELDSRALRGRPYVVTFLYTDCQDVCPLIGRGIGEALRLLGGRRDEVAALAVSVDPEGDTRQAVLASAPAAARQLPLSDRLASTACAGVARVLRRAAAAGSPREQAHSEHLADRSERPPADQILGRFPGTAPRSGARPQAVAR
jgi:hypothetical protein